MFQTSFRDDECIVNRTVLLSGGSLMSSALGIAMVGRLLWAVFGMTWLILLHHWVPMVVVAFGVNRSVILFCVVIANFTMTGFRAAPASSF